MILAIAGSDRDLEARHPLCATSAQGKLDSGVGAVARECR